MKNNGRFKVIGIFFLKNINLTKLRPFNRQKVSQEVNEIAEEKIEYLAQLWKELFEKEIGMDHMRKLLNHVDAFFTDIIVETESRKEAIMERIEGKIKFS